MLIAENQDLLLYEDIDNLIEEFLVQLFRQVHARNSDTELVRQGLHIQRASIWPPLHFSTANGIQLSSCQPDRAYVTHDTRLQNTSGRETIDL